MKKDNQGKKKKTKAEKKNKAVDIVCGNDCFEASLGCIEILLRSQCVACIIINLSQSKGAKGHCVLFSQ